MQARSGKDDVATARRPCGAAAKDSGTFGAFHAVDGRSGLLGRGRSGRSGFFFFFFFAGARNGGSWPNSGAPDRGRNRREATRILRGCSRGPGRPSGAPRTTTPPAERTDVRGARNHCGSTIHRGASIEPRRGGFSTGPPPTAAKDCGGGSFHRSRFPTCSAAGLRVRKQSLAGEPARITRRRVSCVAGGEPKTTGVQAELQRVRGARTRTRAGFRRLAPRSAAVRFEREQRSVTRLAGTLGRAAGVLGGDARIRAHCAGGDWTEARRTGNLPTAKPRVGHRRESKALAGCLRAARPAFGGDRGCPNGIGQCHGQKT